MTSPITDLPLDADEAARAARTARRSEQILKAAARLMERRGSHAVSMQAIADEAGVSVGLIYRYFAGKEELLLGVIVDVLEQYGRRIPAVVEAAGDDPVDRLSAGFREYCTVIDENRHAAVLTYRESKMLGETGLETIKRMEVASIRPLRDVLQHGIAAGTFRAVDVDVVSHDLLVLAHAWALKHWYYESIDLDFESYVATQLDTVLASLRP